MDKKVSEAREAYYASLLDKYGHMTLKELYDIHPQMQDPRIQEMHGWLKDEQFPHSITVRGFCEIYYPHRKMDVIGFLTSYEIISRKRAEKQE